MSNALHAGLFQKCVAWIEFDVRRLFAQLDRFDQLFVSGLQDDVTLAARSCDGDRDGIDKSKAGLDLFKDEPQITSRRAPLPTQLVLRMAAVVDPTCEEDTKVFARSFLERLAQVFGGGDRVFMRFVVVSNAAKENVVSEVRAQHVKHPRSLLILVWVEQLEQILRVAIEDRRALSPLVLKDTSCRVLHVRLKHFLTFVTLEEHAREVSREALAQPQVRPRRLRYRIAKPLMSDLVCDQTHIRGGNAVRLAHPVRTGSRK